MAVPHTLAIACFLPTNALFTALAVRGVFTLFRGIFAVFHTSVCSTVTEVGDEKPQPLLD